MTAIIGDHNLLQYHDNFNHISGHIPCFVCNCFISDTSRDLYNLFSTHTNGTAPSYILNAIFNRTLSEDSVHSHYICNNCFKLCTEYEEVEQRLLEIRLELVKAFNQTAMKLNLDPIEMEDDEIDELDEQIVGGEPQVEEEPQNVAVVLSSQLIHPSTVQSMPIVSVFQSAAVNGQESKMQLINSQGEVEDVVVEDYEEEEEVMDNESIDPEESNEAGTSENVKQEYFDEENGNMVEIVAENDGDDYASMIIENPDENSIDAFKLLKYTTAPNIPQSKPTGKNIVYNIKLEPEEDDDSSDNQQPKKKRAKTKSSSFDKQDSLSREEIFTRDDESFICQLCPNDNSVAYDNRSIGSHLKAIHDIKLYFCDICGEDFRRRNELTEHLDEHITATEDGVFSCEVCQRVFHNLRLFRIHKRLHYTAPKTWECSVCNKKYSSKNLLDEHMNMHTGKRPYKCQHCDKDFASKYTLSAHMKTHADRPRPYECKTCNKSFYSGQNLVQHEKTHTGVKPYQCEECDKCFSTQHNLEVHKIIHTGFKPFICRTCCKAFARRAEIKDHERTHTGEKPFKCDICDATFAQRSNLQSHKRATHLDDKRYVCDICDRRFKRRRLLDYHKKATHTGERPFACTLCSATFVYPEHFKKHMRIHTGVKPYACEICKKTFNSRDNRNAHRFVHSDKKPYECTVCGQGFMRKPLLFAHMKTLGHLQDKIIINQPRITTDYNADDKHGGSEFILETQRILIDKDTSNSELLSVLSNDDCDIEGYIEEHIEEEQIIGEEDLIIDGHVQLGQGEQMSAEELDTKDILEDGVFMEDIESGQIFVSEEGQLYETENGTVQFVKINFDKSDKSNAWMKVES